MDDTVKTKSHLIAEIQKLRTRLELLEDVQVRGKLTEKSLLETETRYRLFTENVRDVIWTMDMNLRYTFMSPSVEHLLGRNAEDVLREPFYSLVTPESLEICQRVVEEEALEEKREGDPQRSRRVELELYRHDGSTVWAELLITFLRNEYGKPIQILGVTRDISDRKKAQAELQRWAHVFNNAHWGIAVVCADSDRFQMVNEAYAKMHGWRVDELVGLHVESVYPEDCLPDRWKQIDTVHRKGQHNYETKHIRKDGGVFPVSVYSTAIKDDHDRVVCRAVSAMDITEHKRGEKAVRMASRMEATATLAGGIAHDFNNLMVGVLGNAGLVRLQLGEDHPCVHLLKDIEHAAQKAGALSQQMLAFARGGKYQPKAISLNQTVNEAAELQAHSIPPRILMKRELTPGLWSVMADPVQMGQVIMNLWLNAVEAIDGHGEIRVATRNVLVDDESAAERRGLEPGRYVVLSVEDTGHGMEEETRARVFEPFFTTKNQGRGLGLAAVYGIVKNHGGYIYADAAPGRGAAFTVYLPATMAAAEPVKAVGVDCPGGQETILVVDDEAMVVSVTRQLLERFGYEVIAASNGKEALEVAANYEGDIALTLLDMGMPVMGGAETFPKLREVRPDMKVVICSGYELGAASQKLLDDGAHSFLQKPFTPRALCEVIRRAMDHS